MCSISYSSYLFRRVPKVRRSSHNRTIYGNSLINIINFKDEDIIVGASFVSKKALNLGIILAGGALNFSEILGYGAKALPLIILNILIAFAVSYLIGRYLKLSQNTRILVGGGTSICGGTAIATLASIIKAREDEIAYAMTAIFLFDIFAALIYPYVGNSLGLTPNQFGILAGTAINDTSSVAASEATYNALNNLDLNLAITVKLTRTTMLIALAVIFASMRFKNEASKGQNIGTGEMVIKIFPWFIVIFLGMAILNTLGDFNLIPGAIGFFKSSYKFFITMALVGVGMKIQFKELFTKGVSP